MLRVSPKRRTHVWKFWITIEVQAQRGTQERAAANSLRAGKVKRVQYSRLEVLYSSVPGYYDVMILKGLCLVCS